MCCANPNLEIVDEVEVLDGVALVMCANCGDAFHALIFPSTQSGTEVTTEYLEVKYA